MNMNTEEAIERIKTRFDKWALDDEDMKAIQTLIPELKESEDERIRKGLIFHLKELMEWKMGTMSPIKAKEHYDSWIAYLERQKEQKSVGCGFEIGDTITDGTSTFKIVGIQDEHYIADDGDKVCFYVAHRYYTPLEQHKEQKPAEWSEEDNYMQKQAIRCVNNSGKLEVSTDEIEDWLKSLPERFNPQPKQKSEPIEIKYAGKIYKVYGTKEFPGGIVGYIIEDEPGHYDCIIHPDEVLGGGYGVKNNGSPYPTKEANFGQPHWKPSEEQMKALLSKLPVVKGGGDKIQDILESLYDDLKKLM